MPRDIEQELLATAREADMKEDQMYADTAPAGNFSQKYLNMVVEDLNKLNKMFGTDAYPEFDADLQGPFPPEFVRNLTMVLQAGEDYNPEYAFDLMTVADDNGLMSLMEVLQGLAGDTGFRAFLKQQPAEEEPTEDMATEAEVLETEAPASGEELPLDELLMKRM